MHYKEYLVSLINQNQIDPAVEMSLQELQQTVRRAGIDVPAYDLEEQQEEMYLTRLRQVRRIIVIIITSSPSSSSSVLPPPNGKCYVFIFAYMSACKRHYGNAWADFMKFSG